jgi:hypothetical protein
MSDAKKKCDLPQLDLECILLRAGVPVKHWPEWADLTYFGIRPSDAARHCRGSAKALSDILSAVSERYFKKLGVRFPPASYKPSRKQLASVVT